MHHDTDSDSARQALFTELGLLDSPTEPAFDALVRTASRVCRCPIALFSLIDTDRQWFKAGIGLPVSETPRDQAFCAHAVEGDGLFEVPDACDDARFVKNPLVTGAPNIRFYAGQPVVFEGVALGTICVADRSARYLSADQRATLADLALVASELLHGRLQARKLAEAHTAVQASERHLRSLADNMPALIAYIDRDERYRFVNAHIGRVFGVDQSLMLGKTMSEVRAEVYPTIAPYIRQALGGTTASFDSSGVLNGQTHDFHADYVPDIGPDGVVQGFYAMTYDISDRKAAEQARAANERMLRGLTDNLPALVCYVGKDLRYRFANDTYRKWLGLDPVSMIGQKVFNFFSTKTFAEMEPFIERAHAGEQVRFERTERIGGIERHFVVEYAPDVDEHGVVDGVYSMTTDVTERRQAESKLAYSEKRLLDICNNIPAVIGQFDMQERCVFANDVGLRAHGLGRRDLSTLTFSSHIDADLYEQHRPAIRDVLAGKRAVVHGQRQNGDQSIWFKAHLVPDYGGDGRQRGFFVMTFDVSSLKRAELERSAADRRLRDITESLPVLISHVDLDERITYVNKTFRTHLGRTEEQLVGLTLADAIGPAMYAQRKPYFTRCLDGERLTFNMESSIQGITRHLQTTYLPDIGLDKAVVGMTTLSVDVTDLKLAELRLRRLAHVDTLTGLPNRLRFNAELEEVFGHEEHSGQSTAVMFLDVDHFKTVNDTHGHAVGDALLQTFAQRLQRSVRTTDLVARLAGDEFVVILRDISGAAEAHRVSRNVVACISEPFAVQGVKLQVTTSVGVALRDHATADPSALMARADGALYEAKHAGRNTYRLAA